MKLAATPAVPAAGTCSLLLQGTDLLSTLCKAVDIRALARVACTCRALRTIASAEEVWFHHCPMAWRSCGVRTRADTPQARGDAGASNSFGGKQASHGTAEGARVPGAWIDAYANWRSLAIAAATAPPAPSSEAEVCCLAASLVAQSRIAHADFVLCQRCTHILALCEYRPCVGVWLDLFVLIGHVLGDQPRMRFVLNKAVYHLCAPWVALDPYACGNDKFFDNLCEHCEGVGNFCNAAQCKTLAVAMLLSIASRLADSSAVAGVRVWSGKAGTHSQKSSIWCLYRENIRGH